MSKQMTLGEVVSWLEKAVGLLGPEFRWEGIQHPHSYRGYYQDLAFEPQRICTLSESLYSAKESIGASYWGYKGGEETMYSSTSCWIASEGDCGSELTIEDLESRLRTYWTPVTR